METRSGGPITADRIGHIKMAIEWEINTGTKSQQFDGKEIIKRSESSDSGYAHAQ